MVLCLFLRDRLPSSRRSSIGCTSILGRVLGVSLTNFVQGLMQEILKCETAYWHMSTCLSDLGFLSLTSFNMLQCLVLCSWPVPLSILTVGLFCGKIHNGSMMFRAWHCHGIQFVSQQWHSTANFNYAQLNIEYGRLRKKSAAAHARLIKYCWCDTILQFDSFFVRSLQSPNCSLLWWCRCNCCKLWFQKLFMMYQVQYCIHDIVSDIFVYIN